MWMHPRQAPKALGWQAVGTAAWPSARFAWIVFSGNHGKGYGWRRPIAVGRYSFYRQGWDGGGQLPRFQKTSFCGVLAETSWVQPRRSAKTFDDNGQRRPSPGPLRRWEKAANCRMGSRLDRAFTPIRNSHPEGWALGLTFSNTDARTDKTARYRRNTDVAFAPLRLSKLTKRCDRASEVAFRSTPPPRASNRPPSDAILVYTLGERFKHHTSRGQG